MATCNESLQQAFANDLIDVPILLPATVTPWIGTGLENSLFLIGSSGIQTISFSFIINGGSPNVSVTLFRVEGQSAILLGSTTLTNNNAGFSFDIGVGTHILCIRRGGFVNQSGTFVASFASFPINQTLPQEAGAGEEATCELTASVPPKPDRDCNEPIYFEIVDGELPPGIELDPLGALFGVLPEIDCTNTDHGPSMGWWQDIEGERRPFGRDWYFKVRIQMANTNAEPKERWFAIRLHNNWDTDRDFFDGAGDFEREVVRRVDASVHLLPESLCDLEPKTPKPEGFVPKSVPEQVCDFVETDPEEVWVTDVDNPETPYSIMIERWRFMQNQKFWFVGNGRSGEYGTFDLIT